jgi:hypothetical protein
MMGGGSDLDEAFRWLCRKGNGGDFLVLRANGNDDYPSKKTRSQMLEGWEVTSVVMLEGGEPFTLGDFFDDISLTGELNDRWTPWRTIPTIPISGGYSGEGEHRIRREDERHSGAKVNSSRSEATLAR